MFAAGARRVLSALAILVLAVTVGAVTSTPAVGTPSVTPTFIAGNPDCQDLGYDFGYKPQPEPPPSGTYGFPLTTETVTISSDGVYFDWTSTFGIDAVLVKGGPNTNAYVYDPPTESTGDSGLHSPINPSTGQPYDISHIEFCYDYEVEVSKTADTSYTRTYTWDIKKTGDQTGLTLAEGQQFQVGYTVEAGTTGFVDSDWAVEGTITVDNPWPVAATVQSVTDVVSPGLSATVDCGVSFPYVLAAQGTLSCDYGPLSLPNGDSRTNTATVTTTGLVGGGTGTATVDFSAATVTEVDECIDVTDDKYGALGTVCADEAPKTFTYSMNVGPYSTCGEYQFTNTADFITKDTGATGSSSWTVDVNVPCDGGCTLTQGYWKTHSLFGPAPYDDAWLAIGPAGADAAFYLSGQSYYDVLWTSPAGNAYYNLAHQYIAAKLNVLNGASAPTAVTDALASAEAFFAAKTPSDQLAGSSRRAVLEWAATLDQYNNGLIGPGHCSEDTSPKS